MSTHDVQSVKDKVLSAITEGKVAMRPKWHFVLKTALLAIGFAVLFLLILYTVSFVIFALHESGIWFTPAFGGTGWFLFFRSLPWLLIILSLIFIAILEILVRRFSFGYRQPLLYSALGIILVTTFGSVLLAGTPLHQMLFRAAESDDLPFFGDFYRGFGAPDISDVHVGVFTDVLPDGFSLVGRRHEMHHVIVTNDTRFPFGTAFAKGDMVIVIGDEASGTIRAVGILKADDSVDMPPGIPGPDRDEHQEVQVHFAW